MFRLRTRGHSVWCRAALVTILLALPYSALGSSHTKISILHSVIGPKFVPLWIAYEQGLFAKHGIDVQSAQLSAKGFSVLLDMSQTNIPSIQDGLAVATPYLREHPDVVEKVVAGLTEGIVFSLSPRNKDIVLKTLMARLNISSPEAAEAAYQVALASVNRRPYLSVPAGQAYQRVLARNDPRVITVKIEDLVDNTFVRKLDESGDLDRLYFSYGVK